MLHHCQNTADIEVITAPQANSFVIDLFICDTPIRHRSVASELVIISLTPGKREIENGCHQSHSCSSRQRGIVFTWNQVPR